MKKLIAVLAVLLILTLSLPLSVFADAPAVPPAVDTTAVSDPDETDPETVMLETEDDGPKMNFGFYPDTMKETLPIMGMGMLGIFLVIGVIIIVVVILGKIGDRFDQDEDED